jgi:hypothetical protein
MKTSLTLLWIAFIGAVTAFTIHEVRQSKMVLGQVPVSAGTPVRLKGCDQPGKDCDLAVQSFENLLTKIDNGTHVTIVYQSSDGKYETVDGPPFGNPQPAQPGSMHVTQSISLSSLDQLNDVLNSLAPDSNTTAANSSNTPTPTP